MRINLIIQSPLRGKVLLIVTFGFEFRGEPFYPVVLLSPDLSRNLWMRHGALLSGQSMPRSGIIITSCNWYWKKSLHQCVCGDDCQVFDDGTAFRFRLLRSASIGHRQITRNSQPSIFRRSESLDSWIQQRLQFFQRSWILWASFELSDW